MKTLSERLSTESIEIQPIGFVKTNVHKVMKKNNLSEIIIHENLKEALEGIQDFSHLYIIF